MLIHEIQSPATPAPAQQRVDALKQQLATARTQVKQQRLQAQQRKLSQQRVQLARDSRSPQSRAQA